MNGLFWEDLPPVVKTKHDAPEQTWLLPDFLPYLEEAKEMRGVDFFTHQELYEAAVHKETMLMDIESYWNYFQVAFKSVDSGKVWIVEAIGESAIVDMAQLSWLLHNFQIVTFNGIWYDEPIATLALAGLSCAQLKICTNRIIEDGVDKNQLYKEFGARKLHLDHIDLKEVAPLQANLKIYGGRVHTLKMQDLPFPPSIRLNDDQISIVRYYCCNDLNTTHDLYNAVFQELLLRCSMSEQYGIDLRSKSDAQIAEYVIKHELEKLFGYKIKRPSIAPGTSYKYTVPQHMRFQTPLLQNLLEEVSKADFVISEKGSVILPKVLNGRLLTIGSSVYKLGIGGIHSTEESQAVIGDDVNIVRDADVTAFYPNIILLQKLAPPHLGDAFLEIYQGIVDRRVTAKHRAGDVKKELENALLKELERSHLIGELQDCEVLNNVLKIVINGSFGKLGSMWSVLYAPELMFTVTVTGQLSLLMLIEAFELCGIPAKSANTDGVVCLIPKNKESLYTQICDWWQETTGYGLEYADYSALYSASVNNYIAVKTNGKCKNKGAYVDEWKGDGTFMRLKKNPNSTICIQAVEQYLLHKTPIEETVMACKDVRCFVTVRGVDGGGVVVYKDALSEYLGKAVRWYYAHNGGDMVYARNGNMVPTATGVRPLMELPKNNTVPIDLDYQKYIYMAEGILVDIGAIQPTANALQNPFGVLT